jgi:prevent-host-death family protein
MGTHTVAEARDRLPELIERAREGEAVVITQDGTPVAEITPLRKQPAVTHANLEWLRAHRPTRQSMTIDAVTLIRAMRDESDS